MAYVIQLWQQPSLAIAGSADRFPVRRIFCVGRNYAEHVKEMGFDAEKEEPFFFAKYAHALMAGGGDLRYPQMTSNLHHEVELVVAIGTAGVSIAADKALEHVHGYAVGIDMTRRDLQQASRVKGRPWTFGKDFAEAAPIGALYPAASTGHRAEASIWLKVNGQMRQDADVRDMVWNVSDTIAFLSQYYPLEAGDIIMTGTPAGVGPVKVGDVLQAGIAGTGELRVNMVAGY